MPEEHGTASRRRRSRAGSPATSASQLAELFRRNGYVRLPDADRAAAEGPDRYKKGYEVRLVAGSARELGRIRSLLAEAGFEPGRPFVKGQQYRQPIYGRQAVVRFLRMVRAEESA